MENIEETDYPSDYENETSDTEEEIEIPRQTSSKSRISIDEEGKTTNNKTFTYFQVREINNANNILMKKVLAHSTRQNKQPKPMNYNGPKLTSAEVNRRKKQRQIDHDNLVLLKKIQTIKPFGLSKSKVKL